MQPLLKPITTPQLIARALHIELLQQQLERARDGAGGCILIQGDAGIGKSRLASTFAAAVDASVLRGACYQSGQGEPLSGLQSLLHTLALADVAVSARPASVGPHLLQEIVKVAGDHVLLLIVEDIHWADEATLEFLLLLARRAADKPILLLLTARPTAVSMPLAKLLGSLTRERLAYEMNLQPLSREAVDALLRALLLWQRPAPARFLDRVYRLSEGNPFFIEEIIGALIAGGALRRQSNQWRLHGTATLSVPGTLKPIIQQRLNPLSQQARELLSVAAVAGRQFDFELLHSITAYDEETLLTLIAELVDAQLVLEVESDRFAFRHALTREAIYDGLLARIRRRRHAEIAAYYEQRAQPLAQLAYHHTMAEQWVQAQQYSERAAADAAASFAPHTVLTHLERAQQAATKTAGDLSLRALHLRGGARQMIGEFEGAKADFEKLLLHARADQDLGYEWHALHDLGYLWMALEYDKAEPYLRAALRLAQRLDEERLIAQSLNRLANLEANRGRPDQALPLHVDALAIFERLNDDRGCATTHDLIGTVHGICGHVAQSAAHYQQALPLLRRLGDRQATASCLMMLSMSGDVAACREAIEITRDISWRDGEAYAHIRLALLYGEQGNFGGAFEHAAEGLVIAEAVAHPVWQMAAHLTEGSGEFLTGNFGTAAAKLLRALNMAREVGATVWIDSALAMLIRTHVSAGHTDEARGLLADAGDYVGRSKLFGGRLLALAAAELALAANQPDRVVAIVEAINEIRPAGVADRRTIDTDLLFVEGCARIALQQPQQAEALLRRALAASEQQLRRPLAWRCHAALARIHLQLDQRTQAAAQLESARRIADDLAATLQEDRQRMLFEQFVAGHLPALPELTPLQQRKRAHDGLTRREREVARLVARGMSNPEIGEALVVSVRTVKSHVGNILAKLNFSSRTQIAAWAVDKGLLDD